MMTERYGERTTNAVAMQLEYPGPIRSDNAFGPATIQADKIFVGLCRNTHRSFILGLRPLIKVSKYEPNCL